MMNNEIKNEIVYKYLEHSELSGISRLIKSMKTDSDEVLNIRDNSIDYYDWMYFKNPAGNAVIASAWHNQVLVSTFAMAPKRAIIAGEERLIGKTMDMFTDPHYQGLGIISTLTKMVFNESKNQGIEGWYVTPSKNSYPIFKNKWKYEEPIEPYFKYKILDIRRLAGSINISKSKKMILKLGAFITHPFFSVKKSNKNYNFIPIDSFGEEFDEFWNSVKDGYDNALIRDSIYLNWRFRDNPDKYETYALNDDNQVKGYVVMKHTVRKGVKTGEIVDVLFDRSTPENGIELLKFAQQKLLQCGCAICEAWSFADSFIDDIYVKSGIKRNRTIIKFLLSPDNAIPNFYDKTKWFLTQSDGNDI